MEGYFLIKVLALLVLLGGYWTLRDNKRRAAVKVDEILEFERLVRKSMDKELPELIGCQIGNDQFQNIHIAGNGKLLFLWPAINTGEHVGPNSLMKPLTIGMKDDLELAPSYLLNDVLLVKRVEWFGGNSTLLIGKLDNAFMNGTLGGSWKLNTKVNLAIGWDKLEPLVERSNFASVNE
jgi:hypothetical protein